MKSLLLVSLLVVPTLKNVTVSTEVTSLTGVELSSRDLVITATDIASGEEFVADQDGNLNLTEGAYTLTGEGDFCFLVAKDVIITSESKSLSLEAGCE